MFFMRLFSQCFFGIGMMQCGAFEVLKEKDAGTFTHRLRKCIPNKTEYNLVREMLLQKHGIAVAYGYSLYRCSKCGSFHNLFHYQKNMMGASFLPWLPF